LRNSLAEALQKGIADLRTCMQEEMQRGFERAYLEGEVLMPPQTSGGEGQDEQAAEKPGHEWMGRHMRTWHWREEAEGEDSNVEVPQAAAPSTSVKGWLQKKARSLSRMNLGSHDEHEDRDSQEGEAANVVKPIRDWLSPVPKSRDCQSSPLSPVLPPPKSKDGHTSPMSPVLQAEALIMPFDRDSAESASVGVPGVPESLDDVASSPDPASENIARHELVDKSFVGRPGLDRDDAGVLRSTSSRYSMAFFTSPKFKTSKTAIWHNGRKHSVLTHAVVLSPKFDTFMCFFILMNSVVLGAQTDFRAKNPDEDPPRILFHCEIAFCFVFVMELVLRLYVHRSRFFYMSGWQWNVFDCVLITLQLCEQIMLAVLPADEQSDGQALVGVNDFSAARVVRLLRLIRVLRVARVLQGISELRILVVSILNSVKSLFFSMVLLVLLIYTVSLYLTQVVTDHRQDLQEDSRISIELRLYFGSLATTMLSMFAAITGGVDWAVLCNPLKNEISPVLAVFFSIYIAFSLLAMLNMVTGVFVESVLKSQQIDRDHFIINNTRELFLGLQGGLAATMNWDIFKNKLEAPQMQSFFKFLDVDPSDASGLFRLLDIDGSGEVSAEEFLNGAVRLRGHAKAMDVALLIQEVRQIGKDLKRQSLRGAR